MTEERCENICFIQYLIVQS